MGLDVNDTILDLCCGQGRHALELAKRGFNHVIGIDRSKYLIRLAKKRMRQHDVQIQFHEGDARKIRLPDSSVHGVVLMGNSYGYFDQVEDDIRVLKSIKRILCSNGKLALDLTDGDWTRNHYEPRSWEWIDSNHFVCRERSLSSDNSRLISREVVVHAEFGVIADQFYAERLYSRESIKNLLEELDFTQIAFHQDIIPNSYRDQDLGMMAHRMFITCKAPKKAKYKAAAKAPYFPKVSVLLGDPRLPDSIKINQQFNEEDFLTIRKLKEALADLQEFSFEYYDNHHSLQSDLQKHRPAFVLNLADEGYYNEAFKELHIPALLEIMNIPYTGAGPACLGLCYNKSIVRSIAQNLDIPVPLETYTSWDDQAANLPSIFPALVKPNCGDSSIGITQQAVVHSSEELVDYLESLKNNFPNRSFLVQEFLEGEEYSLGMVGNPGLGFDVLPILEVDYSKLEGSLPRILSYESKWMPDSPYWNQITYKRAMLPDDDYRRLVDYSTSLFERLGCNDYVRFDYRRDSAGQIKLLEVNPNPGWCWDGKMNIMAGFDGMRYADLLKKIIYVAQTRIHVSNSS